MCHKMFQCQGILTHSIAFLMISLKIFVDKISVVFFLFFFFWGGGGGGHDKLRNHTFIFSCDNLNK